ncbi:MAG TPA: Gfo/Idh/MocA family oxidoreductase [Candidatus Sulfopaludibacter sp.]|jgi:predicted dehydrogenase|nr:Gfo/Idh/MocA family oxidoreductase [Candidatus Sulfopaludibacter sp.]
MSENNDLSRRDLLKAAGAVTAVASALPITARAANDPVRYGMIGTGSRGTYLLKHLKGIESGKCVALCDINPEHLKQGVETIGSNPRTYSDYHQLLEQKDIEAVFVITPLFVHFPLTKDVLQAGKHVFCEKCLVFKPEEVHALNALAQEHSKQILQTGLQRRYSYFYQTVKDMVDKKILGDVHHIHAQWHRNMINKPSRLWTMKPGGEKNIDNWRVYRSMSGGLTAELTSHQVDVADWMFGQRPDFVMGLGSLDMLKDGRDVYDNIQLIYKYPNGQKLTYSSISTNQFLPYFNGNRPEMGEIIMGTEGTIEITVGDDVHPPIAWWYREPPKTTTVAAPEDKKKPFVAGATMVASGGANGPIPLNTPDLAFNGNESFLQKEAKFARRWLTSKGVMVQEESRNPVDLELEGFFKNCRDGGTPRANLEVGMADAVAVILSNMAMDEGRKVYFNEIDKMGTDKKLTTQVPGKPAHNVGG